MASRSPTQHDAQRTVVAVINSSADTIEMLSTVLEQAGFVVISGYTHDIRQGKLDFEAFVRQHRPRVIVYDIAPPYDRNFRLFEHLRSLGCSEDCTFVLTSTHASHVEKLAHKDDRVFEIVGKPMDLDLIVEAVRQAARARRVR